MPKVNKKSRYSFYTVKQKHNKNVVRSLHYLTNYNYILRETLFDKDEEPCYKLSGIDLKSEFINNNIIYKKESSNIELSDYEIVINEVDSLALNVKAKYITFIKNFIDTHTILKTPSNNNKITDFFFNDKLKQLFILSMQANTNLSKEYINRVYNQLHSRIIFRYFHELYSNPTAVIIQGNKIKPILLDELQELRIIESFINRFKWIFDEPILNELQRRKEQYRIEELEREKYIASIKDIDKVNRFFHFNMVLDTDDSLYNDSIQILFQGADALFENLGYYNSIEVNWSYQVSDEAEQWYEMEENNLININDVATNYIKEYNQKYFNEFPIIYEAINSDKDLQYGDEYYEDIIDYETYQDNSNKDETRESALSFDQQWENTFKYLYRNIISDNIDENIYLQFIQFAEQVNSEYYELLINDSFFFTKTGKIARNKYYRLIDDDYYEKIKKHSKGATTQQIQKIKFKLMKLKRARWELIYKLANISLIQNIKDFDIESLQFINMDDCPF